MIAHLDLDAFFAAVEQLVRPELRGRPVVVGGDPHGRGVVATASYEARAFGVRSAMSSAEASRRCPQAVFVRPDHERYRAHSRAVWEEVGAFVGRVEQTGIDEGYLDLEGLVRGSADASALLAALQAAVRDATGLTCSLGAGTSKTVAKIASDRRKPGGLVVVPAGGERDFLAPLPLRLLPGIGPRSEQRLAASGLATIGDLAGLGDGALATALPGKVGRDLRRRARGDDPRAVVTEPAEPVSLGYEETFDRDISDDGRLRDELDRLAVRAWGSLGRRGYGARTVTTKVRYADFAIVTRSQTVDAALAGEDDLRALAAELLERALRDRREPIRLLGVYLSKLERDVQLALPL